MASETETPRRSRAAYCRKPPRCAVTCGLLPPPRGSASSALPPLPGSLSCGAAGCAQQPHSRPCSSEPAGGEGTLSTEFLKCPPVRQVKPQVHFVTRHKGECAFGLRVWENGYPKENLELVIRRRGKRVFEKSRVHSLPPQVGKTT